MSLYRIFRQEVARNLPAVAPSAGPDPEYWPPSLPEPAERFLRFAGVASRPRDWSFRVGFTGRFRTRPQQGWMRCEAWQYNCRPALRCFYIRIRFAGLVPVVGRDTYLHGKGRMLVKLLDLFPVADGQGEEYDTSELVSYLNDAVLIAPSMLLVPAVSWAAVDEDAFDVSLTSHGRTVTGRVLVDRLGAPREFSTTDRFCYDPREPRKLIRARWTTPIDGWEIPDGRPSPTRAQAVWHLPGGPFPYADFRRIPGSLVFNIPPSA